MTEYKLDNKFNDSFKQVALGVSIGENNQLAEFAKILRSGAQMVELDLASLYGHTGQGTSAEKIGKTEREAIGNLAKTTNSDLSVHAPWSINFSGINPKTGEKDTSYSELMRNEIEAAIKFTDEISRPMGRRNMPIIFHAASDNFGTPDPRSRITVYDKKDDKVISIGPSKIMNTSLEEFKNVYGEDTFKRLRGEIAQKKTDRNEAYIEFTPQGALNFQLDQLRIGMSQQLSTIDISERNIERRLIEVANEFVEAKAKGENRESELSAKKERLLQEKKDLSTERYRLQKEIDNLGSRFVSFSEEAPKLAAEGIKNAALMAAKTKTAPMILVENTMSPDMSLSKPEDVKKTIDAARELFVEAAMKDEKLRLSRSDAEKLSRDLIGVNLDVGHLNIFKSYTNPKTGKPYSDKDIVKMAGTLGDYVKRYHLNDNMGNIDAHLPLGEGTTPIKEIYETLRNAGVEAPAIMEVFGGVGGITAGMGPSMQYMGAPLFDNMPYAGLPAYAGRPYSSIVGDYSSYLNLGLRNDLFQYGGFSGISPTFGAGYMQNERGGEGGFSGAPII
ncbi:MAG: TIM barrel protein [Candidatus Parvarchaeota archaeon]|nr:TIM barrel protein [Candidatus Parvarchaeota archaeon]